MFKELSMILFVAAVFLSGNPAHAQSPTAEPEKWREDLRYIRDELPRRHINLFHTLSPEVFHDAVNELDATIPSLPDHAIIVRMTRLLAMVKEDHTYLDWANPTRTPHFRRLPLRFLMFKDGLYVTQAAKLDFETIHGRNYYARAIGMRVARIGDVEIESAVQEMATIISADNTEDVKDSIPRHAHRPEILHALGLIQNLDHVPITLEGAEGNRLELNLISSPSGVIPQFSSNPYPSRAPIQLYRTRPSLNQYGKLFVLIDNGAKSSAMRNAILFKQLQTNPILVGAPTGGKPNSYGEIKSFPLPNSGLNVYYSTKYFQLVPGEAPSLTPDILVELTAKDYFAGRDPVLEAVLAY